MIVIVSRVPVAPEKRREFVEKAQPAIAASRKEAGNISYNLYLGTEDPGLVVFVEEWKTKADLGAHLKAEHFLAFREEQKGLVNGEREIKVYTVPEDSL